MPRVDNGWYRCVNRNRMGDLCTLDRYHDDDHHYAQEDFRAIDQERALTDTEALEYLALDSGSVPCSRYGRNSIECAPVALAIARILEGETGEPMSLDSLEHAMGLVVNDHEDPGYLIREYGAEYGYSADMWE